MATLSATKRLAPAVLAVGLAALAAVVAGCGDAATPLSSSASPSSAAATAAVSAFAAVTSDDIAAAVALGRRDDSLDLPYHEYRLVGQYDVADVSGSVAVLRRNAGRHEEMWLMDLADGSVRRVLAKGTTAAGAFTIGSASVSDGWIAWEEVGPGDDLAEEVDWRLYMAPLHRSSLTIGERSLVAAASNRQASRPLFDLAGSQLAWMSNSPGSARAKRRSLVMVRDLAGGKPRVLYRAAGVLVTLGYSDATVVVTESPVGQASGAEVESIVRLNGDTGDVLAKLSVPSEHGLSHWPVWRGGWVAWTPFPSADATFPELYIRDAAGGLRGEGGFAVDPCIAGDYLFFKTERAQSLDEDLVYEVRALRLGDETSTVLVSDAPESGWHWHGLVRAPSLERRYVAYADNILTASRVADWRTLIRVYDVP